VISNELWRRWSAQGKRREEAAARKIKAAAVLIFGLLAMAGATYFFGIR
jgi:hypothetical protein